MAYLMMAPTRAYDKSVALRLFKTGLYVPIDDQRSAVAAVAEGVCAYALDLHLPVEPQVADVVVHHYVVEIERGDAPFGHAGRPPDLVHGRADVEEPGADAREMPVSARDDPA